MRSFLFWLAMRLPCRVIAEARKPYLERYYVTQAFGWRCYLHRFVASDPDRGVHDHPWLLAFSIILVGWYYEVRRWGVRRVRWFNVIRGDTFHRVLVGNDFARGDVQAYTTSDGPFPEPPREVWSLFFHRAEDAKVWGFLRRSHRESPDCLVYYPFTYNGKKKNNRWELTAPRGGDLKRDARGVALPEQDPYAGD